MARLVIQQKRGKFAIKVPHKVLINGHLLGILKDPQVVIDLPYGNYDVTIQSMFPYFSATEAVTVAPQRETTLVFSDREQWWDAVFVVEIVLWIAKRFFYIASPWTWIYEIFTNGYFVLWLFYEWRIRNQYFKFEIK